MQRVLTAYCQSGGNVLVSGSYIGSDMNDSQGNRSFTSDILKYSFGGNLNTPNAVTNINGLGRNFTIPGQPNEETYPVVNPDILQPVGTAFPVMLYNGSQCAATAYQGNYRTFAMGFPFESIRQETDRNAIMASILHFFGQKNKK